MRAHQDGRFLPGKGGQDFLHATRTAGAVAVQPQHGPPGQHAQALSQALGAFAQGQKIHALALRAGRGKGPGIAAIVTNQLFPPLMVGEPDLALRAAQGAVAVQTVHQRRVAAPVEQDHGLLAPVQGFAQGRFTLRGQQAVPVHCGDDRGHRADIDQFHRRQRLAAHPARQTEEGQMAVFRRVKGFNVRRGRPQQQQTARLGHAEPGHFLGLVGKALILFEGAVVLFIQHHAAQPGYGQKKSRARAHHQTGFAPGGQSAEGGLTPGRRLITVVKKERRVRQGAGRVTAQLVGQRHFRSFFSLQLSRRTLRCSA